MANKTLLALAALAGFGLYGGGALADTPKNPPPRPAITTPVKKIPDKSLSDMIIKHLQITKDSATTHRDGKSILRNYLSFDVNFATTLINGLEYERGHSLGVSGRIDWQAIKWLNLMGKFDLNYQGFGLTQDNATEKILNTSLSLEGRTKLYFSKDLRLQLGLGADYVMEHDSLIFQGADGNSTRHNIGPMISLSLETKHCDLYIAGSALWGTRTTPLDRSRDTLMQHLTLEIVPRYMRFEMPTRIDAYHWSINDYIVDRHNLRVRLNTRPSVSIIPHLKLYLNFSYTYNTGMDYYQIFEIGGGAMLKWRGL